MTRAPFISPLSKFLRLVITTAVAAASHAAFCQGLFNETDIHVNGVGVYIDGELNNDGVLQNNGALFVTGDWKSKGKYEGIGTVTVHGNSPQKITHFNQSISTLVVDGWGNKFIKGTLNITGNLQLIHGIVEVSPEDALKLRQTAGIIGGSSVSYVDGALAVEGSGYKYFPIGKNGNYAPVEFLDVTGDNLQFSVEVFENAPVLSVEDVVVKNALYWQRKDIQGTFGSSPVSIDYDRRYFDNPDNIILVGGSEWTEPFLTVKEISHSTETEKITTLVPISTHILLLGEISDKWTEADFYFPTALSPHASHADNHRVKIFGERLSGDQFHFQVFNRWGDVVYENRSLEQMSLNGWDGRSASGQALPGGAYPYRLAARDKTGQKFEKKGVITIIY